MNERLTGRYKTAALWLLALTLTAISCTPGSDDASPSNTLAIAPTSSIPPVGPLSTTAVAPTTAAPVPTTTTLPPPEPKPYGGRVVFGVDSEPESLNPFKPDGATSVVSLLGQTYWAGVQDVDAETLEFIPDVVTELPTIENGGVVVNEDGTMTINYKIRKEAVWSDGRAITGGDFQFTLDTIMDPELPIQKTIYEDIISTVPLHKRFSYTLSSPTVQYELLFNTLIPKHDVEGSDFLNDWDDRMWVSGGPFVFVDWFPGMRIRMARNENYWKVDEETGQQLPYLDEFVLRFSPEGMTPTDMFVAGLVDIVNPAPDVEAIGELEALDGAEIEVANGPGWEHLNFQYGPGRLELNPTSLNANLNFRKAIAHAIDRERLVEEVLGGEVGALDSFVDVFVPAVSRGAWAQYEYDPEKARELLAIAMEEADVETVTAVFSTTWTSAPRVDIAELYGEMLREVGIDYEIHLQDSEAFFLDTTVNGRFDLGQWAWGSAPGLSGLVGIWDVFDPEQPPPSGQNQYRWGSPDSAVQDEATVRYAELRDLINETVDTAVLLNLFNEAEQILADQVVIIPLYPQLNVGAVWADRIEGYEHNPTSATDTWNVEKWYRADLG